MRYDDPPLFVLLVDVVWELASSLPNVGRHCVDAYWSLIDQIKSHGISDEAITLGSWTKLVAFRNMIMNPEIVVISPHFEKDPYPLIGDQRWCNAEYGWLAVRHVMTTALRPLFDGVKPYEPQAWLQRNDRVNDNTHFDGHMAHTEWHLAMLVDFIALHGGRTALEQVWADPPLARDYASKMNNAAGNSYYDRIIHSIVFGLSG
jgi:hypothetical protein